MTSVPPTEPAKKTGNGCLLALVAVPVLLIGGCFALIHSGSDGPPDYSISAQIGCEDAVKEQLKSPSSAKFSDENSVGVEGSTVSYRVTGSVDAENSFGASLRYRFVCQGTADDSSSTMSVQSLDPA